MTTKVCKRCSQDLPLESFRKRAGKKNGPEDGRSDRCVTCVDYLIATYGSPNFVELHGQTVGRLTFVSYIGIVGKQRLWECRCSCGNTTNVTSGRVLSGNTSSCGCARSEYVANKNATHRMSKTREHNSWRSMMARCYNSNDKVFHHYGGRGISVCERWHKFENFFLDMGSRPEKMSLDRTDVDGDYCKDNCKWSTQKTQMLNTRRNHHLSFDGETRTISEWSDLVGLEYKVIHSRIQHGWTAERALTEPVHCRQ